KGINVSDTYAELEGRVKKLQEHEYALKKAEPGAVRAEMKEKIAAYGVSAEQLGLSRSKRSMRECTLLYQNGVWPWEGAN
ncbi:hypothetical protein PL75_11400, partial [Neisseria arctica]